MPIPRWSLTQLARRLRPAHRLHHVYERVLGTELEVQIVADTRLQAEGAERAALTEIDRLTAILNRFDHDSELRRWQANPGVRTPLSDDLKAVLRAADHWREVTGGAFHPGADALGMCWKQAEERGRLPEDQDLTALAAQLRLPPWTLDSDGTGTFQAMYPVGLNALAKGYVVDRAAEAAFGEPGVRTVLINVGGDLRTLGEVGLGVAVADPFSPRDDLPPLCHVQVRNGALATSGQSHRGYQVGETWYSHVLDPRTGHPITEVPGVTVTASDCLTADALATALSVLDVQRGLALVDGTPGAAALIVTRDGAQHLSRFWTAQPHPRPTPP
ncbi:FAD:protein FMN transferase [Deinococcus hopiensis]|uniref:FAD:protein FMN transferase n=1 Tax=Deinococcus hopiensis KR-140 TaxID=695939 RepID=A0A1W1UBA0_9DEIO|nr:FAD:protein FMN transferase [Deinococcus hopiensis]SMB78375.1 thiamine biosynthesis lipoprotein [Deinococcus hopiensis KR-140]